MAFFSLGSGSRRKPEPVQWFEQADCVVMKVFADLHKARYLQSNQFPGISLDAVQRFERKVWDRLIDATAKELRPARFVMAPANGLSQLLQRATAKNATEPTNVVVPFVVAAEKLKQPWTQHPIQR